MLPKHPFPMCAQFRDCFLVNYRINPEILNRYVPKPIIPELHLGEADSSKFGSFEKAKQFLVELYTAFGWDDVKQVVHKIRIERGEWKILVVPDKYANTSSWNQTNI